MFALHLNEYSLLCCGCSNRIYERTRIKLTDCSLHTKLCLVHTMHRNDRRFYTAAGSEQAGGKKGGIQGEVDAAGRYVHRWGCENTFSRNSFQH